MEFKEIESGNSKEMPSKVVVYGEPKVGKTTFAAQFPDPFFIDVEGGLNYLPNKVRSTPKLSSYDEVTAWLKHIYDNDDFTCGTICIDSLDWIERLAQDRLVKKYNASSITDSSVSEFAYYKGVITAANDAMMILRWCNAIHKKKGIGTVLIAHSQVKEVDLPSQDPYQRHEMKLSKYLSNYTYEWADLILFATRTFHVAKDGKKTSEPKPVLLAGGSASFVGGGRMRLSKELPLDYNQLKKEITHE